MHEEYSRGIPIGRIGRAGRNSLGCSTFGPQGSWRFRRADDPDQRRHDAVPGMSEQPVGPGRRSGRATVCRADDLRAAARIEDVDGCDVAVVGLPFDTGVSYRPGARFGPHTSGSAHAAAPAVQPRARRLPVRQPAGGRRRRHRLQPVRHRRGGRARSRQQRVDAARERRRAASASAATTRSRSRCCGRMHRRHGPVALVHFDAHLDTWDTYFGAPLHPRHAVPPRARGGPVARRPQRARRHPRPALRARRPRRRRRARLQRSCTCADFEPRTASPTWSSSCGAAIGDRPLYVSIDIDVLDPAHAPGTGTPEAGGLTSRELLGHAPRFRGAQPGRGRHRRGRARLRPRRDHRHRRGVSRV